MTTTASASAGTTPSPARMDEAMPSCHAGFKANITGRPVNSVCNTSAKAPSTTTTGRHTDARAVSAACRRRLRSRKASNCLGRPRRVEAPAARISTALAAGPGGVKLSVGWRMDWPLLLAQQTAGTPGHDGLNLRQNGQGDLFRIL